MTDLQKQLLESIAKSTKRTMSLLYVQLSLCLYVCVMLAGNGARGYLGAGKDVRLPIIDFPIHFRAFSAIGPWMVVATALCLFFELRRLYRWFGDLSKTRCETARDWSVVVEPSIFSALVLDREMKSTDRLVLSVLTGSVIWLVPVFTVWLFAWEFSALHRFASSAYHALVVVVMTAAAFASGARSDVWVDTQKPRTKALVYILRAVMALVPIDLAAGYMFAAARGEFTPYAEGRFASFFTRVSEPLNLEAERAGFETLDRGAKPEAGSVRTTSEAGAGTPRFIGIDLSSAELQSADFRGADLRGVDFAGSDLTGAMLEGADLRDAVFTRRQINVSDGPFDRLGQRLSPEFRRRKTRADAASARCSESEGESAKNRSGVGRTLNVPATLDGARLANAVASNARFGCARLAGAKMRRIDLTGASLNRSDLAGATLVEAVLRDANLRKADLTCANLDDAELTGADLVGARLDRTSLRVRDFAVRGSESVWGPCAPAFSPDVDAALLRALGESDVHDALIDDRAIASLVPSWSAHAGRAWRVTLRDRCWTATPRAPGAANLCDGPDSATP
ncbi:MAG: pentapeptide repeat-containing protein [Deltaproteobacteria bacterium]|nr:pentapeptide repeat-containing protein [Deltaproteobacteria bacterium]